MGGDGEATPPKRQRGSDIREKPQPPVAPPARDGLIAVGRIAIVFTVVAWLTYVFAYFITGGARDQRKPKVALPVRTRCHLDTPETVRDGQIIP